MTTTALVHGVAISGEATARALASRGYRVILSDDSPTEARRAVAGDLGTELVESPDASRISRLLAEVDFVVPAPGVPETHELIVASLAAGVPLRTEIDLAYEWEQQRPGGPRPMVGVTGTDGKTTTTLMVAALLRAGGLRAAAVGNTEVPLVAALDDDDLDAFAVECSSFRLAWIEQFRCEAAIWLNFAPDHQNWHRSMASYESAKANLWLHQRPTDVAVGCSTDPIVMRRLEQATGHRVSFGLAASDYHYTADDAQGVLCGPGGEITPASRLPRRFPHDVTNALAATAACVESGLVDVHRIGDGLASFVVPPHRIEPIGRHRGIEWYNDSKATSPHAALTAIRSFDSIVLIVGGRNKGLDLGSLALEASRLRAVVAVGEAAGEIESVFTGLCDVARADTMAEAVDRADQAAQAGDVVLLSPACASFDWYPDGGYPARGDDFRAQFLQLSATRTEGVQ